jgi:hypothetical protein
MRHAGIGLGLFAGAALLGGCPVVLVGGAAAIGGGVVYTQLNQAEKTFEADFARVEGATRQALESLEMTPIAREERKKAGMSEESLELTTFARGLKIVIDLERVSPAGVKVRVDAQRGAIQRDKNTATEIILRIDELLRRV